MHRGMCIKGGVIMYSAMDVAKYIILFCKEKGYSISNLKLQKLLYFVQAQFLVTLDFPAFDEEIEAWDFGPVVPSVYRYFRIYGAAEIPRREAVGARRHIRNEEQVIIDEILAQCAGYSATYLVDLTHRQRPWKEAYNRAFDRRISLNSIKEYFS